MASHDFVQFLCLILQEPPLFDVPLAPRPELNFLNNLIHLPNNFANPQVMAQIRITTDIRLVRSVVHFVPDKIVLRVHLTNNASLFAGKLLVEHVYS